MWRVFVCISSQSSAVSLKQESSGQRDPGGEEEWLLF